MSNKQLSSVHWDVVFFKVLSTIMWLSIGILIGAVWWYP